MTYIYHCVMKLFGGTKGYTVRITGDGGKEGMGIRLRSSSSEASSCWVTVTSPDPLCHVIRL